MKKTSIVIITIVAICAAVATGIFLRKSTDSAKPSGDSIAQEESAPIMRLRDKDDTITVHIGADGKQRFTVTSNEGEVKAKLLTMEELLVTLPESAEKVGRGMADISADNSSQEQVQPATPTAPPAQLIERIK